MNFLIDENVPNSYKEFLENNGFEDIKRINDFGKGIPDIQVFKIAQEEKRTIITIDRDFHAYKGEEHFGVISLSGKLENPKEKLIKVINQIQKDERFDSNLCNLFVRITNMNFVVSRKNKWKYKEIPCKYKKN